jgi:8-oxo-dGTP diphosphatase
LSCFLGQQSNRLIIQDYIIYPSGCSIPISNTRIKNKSFKRMSVNEQGITLDRYMVIPRTLIFLTRTEHVLLIKGAPHKRLWANRYNGFGGHLEPGEDVRAAAHRELLEETGLTSPDLRLCGTIVIATGQNPGILLFVFTGTCPDGEPRPSAEGEPVWVAVSDLPTLPLVEDLPALLPRVLAHPPCAPPFAGRYGYDEGGRLRWAFGGEA